ncbi:MAG TPA: V-type ATPase 116kDa subunit family protein [Gemmatimonadota bacterium]|nr:V-type ATPase 116kDa subunit family protein [Gemmatimonadota bacterium]
MTKARVLGPRERLDAVVRVIQDARLLHLVDPRPVGPLRPAERPARSREARHLRAALADIDAVLARFRSSAARPAVPWGQTGSGDFARWARTARRLRRRYEANDERRRELIRERGELDRYERFLVAFESLVPDGARWPRMQSYHLVLKADRVGSFDVFRALLRSALGPEHELLSAPLGNGDLAIVLLVAEGSAGRVESILAGAGIEELRIPERYGVEGLAGALPRMRRRQAAIDVERRELAIARRELAAAHATEMRHARAAIADRLLETEATTHAIESDRAFVIEGWLPESAFPRFSRQIEERFGGDVVVERVAREDWAVEEPPVVLENPRLFRPFEAIVRMFPAPSYGTIDPTPFVAVFFPMFFGVILGDVAYGLALALVAGILHLRSRPGTTLRSISEIAGACAAFTIAFGFVYGEALGDLGRRWLGLRPLVFNREEALIPFFAFTLALGAVHMLLGLLIGASNTFRTHPRQSLGRGISGILILLVITAILAAARVLPAVFFTPSVIAILVAFPILIVVEGVLAPLELVSTLGNILSYARIMALGTASVVMAVVANRMVGATGSIVVGILFALLFHLVNFALGIFGPTIHALRLHYVEFFGKFYSAGGVEYRPFGHWRPDGNSTP